MLYGKICLSRFGDLQLTWFFYSLFTGVENLVANDTVVGDPLFTVPLYIPNIADSLGLEEASLCFEIHGDHDKYFNLVSDQCISVNSHYVAADKFWNIIDEVAIRAVDNSGTCRNIRVSLDACAATVDGFDVTSRMQFDGIQIYPAGIGKRVRISVPNCNTRYSLVMWIQCHVS